MSRILRVVNTEFLSCREHCNSVTKSAKYYSKLGPTDLKGRKTAAQKWLVRQWNDPYVKRAREERYRCRSAFKLLEIDNKFQLLKPGYLVVDCGAAPGSWSQVAVNRVNALGTAGGKPRGSVISIDIQHMLPVEGATLIENCDVTLPTAQQRIEQLTSGKPVDVVLSDMAPPPTGVKSLDHELIVQLAMSVLWLSVSILKQKTSAKDSAGTLLVKLWQGKDTDRVMQAMQKCFGDVRVVKPLASRSNSAEIFILARQFTLSSHVTEPAASGL